MSYLEDARRRLEAMRATPPVQQSQAPTTTMSPHPPMVSTPQSPTGGQPQAPQSPTGGQQDDSYGIVDFLGGAFEAMYNSPGSSLFAPIRAAGEIGDRVAEGGGAESFAGAAGTGFVDAASMGTFDALAAFDYAMRSDAPVGSDEFMTTMADRQDEVNAGLQLARDEQQIGSLLGNIGGFMVPGAAIGRVTYGALRGTTYGTAALHSSLVRNGAIIPTIAGGEAALYRYNSDGTREEILQDAAIAAIGAGILSSVGAGAGAFIRRVRGQNVSPIERLTANELVRAFEAGNARMGASPGDLPNELLASIQRSGADDVIADIYPELRPMIETAIRNPDAEEGRRILLTALAARNRTAIDFPTAVRDAIDVPRTRNPQEFEAFVRSREARLRPQYDQVLDGIQQRGINFRSEGLLSAFDNQVDDLGIAGEDYIREARATLLRELGENAQEGQLSARALHNISARIGRQLNTASGRNSPQRGLRLVRDLMRQSIIDIDAGYAGLSRTYSRAEDQLAAYRQGYAMFGRTGTDQQALTNFMENADTYADITAFTHGVQRRLFEGLQNARTPARMRSYLTENRRTIDNLRAVLGDEEVTALLDRATSLVRQGETVAAMQRAGRTPGQVQAPNVTQSGLFDAVMAARTGALSSRPSPAAVRAGANLLGVGRSPAQTAAESEMVARAATTPVGELPNLMDMMAGISSGRLPTPQQQTVAQRQLGTTGPAIEGGILSLLNQTAGQPQEAPVGEGEARRPAPQGQTYLDMLRNM